MLNRVGTVCLSEQRIQSDLERRTKRKLKFYLQKIYDTTDYSSTNLALPITLVNYCQLLIIFQLFHFYTLKSIPLFNGYYICEGI